MYFKLSCFIECIHIFTSVVEILIISSQSAQANIPIESNDDNNETTEQNDDVDDSGSELNEFGPLDFDHDIIDIFSDNETNNNETESEMRSMTLQKYKELVQLIPQMEKYRNIAGRLEKIIKGKNSEIKFLRSELQKSKNFSNMSIVRYYMMSIP